MVNDMLDVNYIKINTKNLLENIEILKKNYAYPYYVMDVSNNAFFHGMYLIKYLEGKIDYLYVNHFKDLLLIRKYNKEIPVIYEGVIHEDNVYDLVMNNAILVIHDIKTLEMIRELKIKDVVSFLFYIDPKGYYGISKKQDITDYLEWDYTYFKLLGVMAKIEEKDYDEFKYIIRPIAKPEVMLLNFEDDKKKIVGSNAIMFDYSIYGIEQNKRKLFKKEERLLKQVYALYSKVVEVREITHNKKTKFIAVISFGYYHGMNDAIKSVYIQNKLYRIDKITNEFMYVLVDETIKKDMEVEITSENNPLENYFSEHTINYFSLFHCNLPIQFEDYILEKTFIY